MTLGVVVLLSAIVLIGGLAAYMFAQKPVTNVQQLLQQHRYADAAAEAERQRDHFHRAEALKLLGRFDDAIAEYRLSDDPAAEEGIALSLAHLGRDFDDAKRRMEQTIATNPAIQEFQALAQAYVLLRRGDRDEALRLFDDNRVLLETRFRDDYTDPDVLLAETLWLYGQLSEAAGDVERASALSAQAAVWAPGSVWASRAGAGRA
jgi:tetratricopeptide (TPR) repeat protein